MSCVLNFSSISKPCSILHLFNISWALSSSEFTFGTLYSASYPTSCAHQVLVLTIVPSVGIVVLLRALLYSSNSLSWYGEESYIQRMEPGAKVVT